MAELAADAVAVVESVTVAVAEPAADSVAGPHAATSVTMAPAADFVFDLAPGAPCNGTP